MQEFSQVPHREVEFLGVHELVGCGVAVNYGEEFHFVGVVDDFGGLNHVD